MIFTMMVGITVLLINCATQMYAIAKNTVRELNGALVTVLLIDASTLLGLVCVLVYYLMYEYPIIHLAR